MRKDRASMIHRFPVPRGRGMVLSGENRPEPFLSFMENGDDAGEI
jgi:hypothetical protein